MDSSARLTAVAVGVARLGEAPLSAMNVSGRAFQGTGRALSAAAGRLSYTFNLKVLRKAVLSCLAHAHWHATMAGSLDMLLQGPSVAIDTACSSSMVAVHFVRQSMQPGGCSAGVAAGVNLPMNWPTTIMFVAAGMTAPDGRCKALDAAADGYVRAEACICMALRCMHALPVHNDTICPVPPFCRYIAHCDGGLQAANQLVQDTYTSETHL